MLVRIHLTWLLLLLAIGCSQINEKQEIDIGRQSHAKFEAQYGGIYPDPQLQQYVNSIGMQMARNAGRPQLDWQYHVVNSEQINAFAVPGGCVYITHGLLSHLQNEAELAGILGHETTHIAHKHSVQQIERAQAAQGLASVAGIVGGLFGYGNVGDVASIVGSLTLMKYGRDQEKDADLTGLKFMTQAGYNPRGLVQAMQVIEQLSKGGPPEFLSTHPNPGNRVQYLTDAINKNYRDAAETGQIGEEDFRSRVPVAAPAARDGNRRAQPPPSQIIGRKR